MSTTDPLDEFMATLGDDVAQYASHREERVVLKPNGNSLSSTSSVSMSNRGLFDTKTRNKLFLLALRMLESGDPYFSDRSMRERDPVLWEEILGQFDLEAINENNEGNLPPPGTNRASDAMSRYDYALHYAATGKGIPDQEESQKSGGLVDMFMTSLENSSMNARLAESHYRPYDEDEDNDRDSVASISEERYHLLDLMVRKFVRGEDSQYFDYSTALSKFVPDPSIKNYNDDDDF